MSRIVDASVVLAAILDEIEAPAAVELIDSATISTVNLSEVYRKLVDAAVPLPDAVAELARFQMQTVPFDERQAGEAARLRPLTRHLGLSFADRACLGLARISGLPVFTADRDWSKLDLGIDIRLIR